jgi:hypothetical protein
VLQRVHYLLCPTGHSDTQLMWGEEDSSVRCDLSECDHTCQTIEKLAHCNGTIFPIGLHQRNKPAGYQQLTSSFRQVAMNR